MDSFTFALMNILVSIITIFMNFFFVYCMLFPQRGSERLKQPLNVLLGTQIGCNITLPGCIFLYIVIDLYSSSFMVYDVTAEVLFFIMMTSVTSSLWLNVFYCCQIVPAMHPLFIYMKRNIRFFIYSSMIAEKIFFLYGFSQNIASYTLLNQVFNGVAYTTHLNTTQSKFNMVNSFVVVDMCLRCGYLSLCLCVMLTSSCMTILYLRKHMKSMEASSSGVSSPRLQRQMRVTITGIIQTFLFFLCSIWVILTELFDLVLNYNIDLYGHISCTIVCLYSCGTTNNLCVGQKIFRQRVWEVWQTCRKTVGLLSN